MVCCRKSREYDDEDDISVHEIISSPLITSTIMQFVFPLIQMFIWTSYCHNEVNKKLRKII